MKKLFYFFALMIFSFQTFAQSQETPGSTNTPPPSTRGVYPLDIQKSKVTWSIGSIRGTNSGEIRFAEGSLIGKGTDIVSADFTINMFTISCNSIPPGIVNMQVVNVLKADNFFETNRHPTSQLEIISAKKKGKDTYEINGYMTIKNRRNPVTFIAKGGFKDGIFEGIARGIPIDRETYDIAYTGETMGNDLTTKVDNAIDPGFLIDVHIVTKIRK